MEVKIQKLRPGAVTPRRGSADAAGYDLYACPADGQCVTIAPHVTAMIGTGLALAIPAGYFGGVFARSGLASKQGLRPANCVGVIDADYRGECTVALHNDTDEVRTVAPGDRIVADLVLPDKGTSFEEFTTMELLSVAMLIVISTFALDFIHTDRSVFKIVDLDEAWSFLNVAQGKTLANKLVRAGRAMNAAVYFVTQNAAERS